jgi:hypothetical protein
MNVYLLAPKTEGFQDLALANESDLDFVHDNFRGESMAADWMPLAVDVLDRDLEPSDFPAMGSVPVLSGRAVEALRDVLERHGELLPLEGGDFFAYNVTMLPDALDEDASEVKYARSGRVIRIVRYELRPASLQGIEIFKLPQQPRSNCYATDAFAARVDDAGLVGFDFSRRVWSG